MDTQHRKRKCVHKSHAAAATKNRLRHSAATFARDSQCRSVGTPGSWPFGDEAKTDTEWRAVVARTREDIAYWSSLLDDHRVGMRLYAEQKVAEGRSILDLLERTVPDLFARHPISAESSALFWAGLLPLASPYIAEAARHTLPFVKTVGSHVMDFAQQAANSDAIQRATSAVRDYFYPRPLTFRDGSGRRQYRYPDRWWKGGRDLTPEEITDAFGYYIPPHLS